jgi:hypothetical protein
MKALIKALSAKFGVGIFNLRAATLRTVFLPFTAMISAAILPSGLRMAEECKRASASILVLSGECMWLVGPPELPCASRVILLNAA